ncbi:MAG: aspartate/tyrosine/aromatic aminotransferase [Gammaproteobacteria bacterium]|nr:aspartate/tyrosine/aromatic aminotransferase [Gammaproteobacteria bacterium]
MFQNLKPVAPDPLLGVTEAFRADPSTSKIDLGVGVYRDAAGQTPVMKAVREAEQRLIARQTTKAYVGPAGNRPFAEAMTRLTLGDAHPVIAGKRVAALQAPGGSGALRLGAELLKLSGYTGSVQVSDPSWANHVPLLTGAGLATAPYPYYDRATGGIRSADMLAALERLEPGTVVLFHASCHNPTGADLTQADWQAIATLMAEQRLVALVDIAYQGLGNGLAEDAFGARLLAERLPEVLVAVSCSKNFGMYRERVGALLTITETAERTAIAMAHMQGLARRMYSMPPDHGGAVVAEVCGDAALRAAWDAELTAMRSRVNGLRRDFAAAMRRATGSGRFDFIAGQSGMFSMLGLPPEAVMTLRTEHHIYMAPDSRVNIAGFAGPEVERVAAAIASVAGAR